MAMNRASGMAVASAVMGVAALKGALFAPRIAGLVCLVGLVLAVMGLKSPLRKLAIAGIVICLVSLVFANFMTALTCGTASASGAGFG